MDTDRPFDWLAMEAGGKRRHGVILIIVAIAILLYRAIGPLGPDNDNEEPLGKDTQRHYSASDAGYAP